MELGSTLSSLGVGVFAGFLIGYALKKIMKIFAIIIGVFFAGLAYLQFQQIVHVNWDKLEDISEFATQSIANSTGTGIPVIMSSPAFENWGLPVTGGMTLGFSLGFLRG